MKDKVFAKLFAAQGVPVPAPMSVKSLGLFAVRDSMTIFASFTLPPIVSEKLQSFGVPQGTADVSSQLFSPCAMQFISTPLHLIGLDLYNNPNTSNASRISFVTQEYLKTAFARIGRILPAFGIGGVLNKELREKGAKYYKSFEMPKMDEMITKCDASEKDLKGR